MLQGRLYPAIGGDIMTKIIALSVWCNLRGCPKKIELDNLVGHCNRNVVKCYRRKVRSQTFADQAQEKLPFLILREMKTKQNKTKPTKTVKSVGKLVREIKRNFMIIMCL